MLSAVIEMINQTPDFEVMEELVVDPMTNGEKVLKEFEMVLNMPEKERTEYLLKEAIQEFIFQRRVLREEPNNHWRVYSICKSINDISELKGENFKGASLPDKLITVTKLLKFVNPDVILEGVKEYHNSGWCS